MKARLALAIMLLIAGTACGDDAPQVPFKLSQQKPAPQGGAGALPQAPSADGTSYPKGTQRIELSGHALSLKTHGFRAALELDIDQQGKSDALFVVQDEHGVPALAVAYGDAEGLGSVEIKSELSAGPVCEVPSASLARLGPKLVLVRMMLACTPPRVPTAQGAATEPTQEREEPPVAEREPSPDDLPPGEPTAHDWLIPIDEALEAVAELRLRSNALSASWSALDIDGDDHSDLNLALKVGAEGVEPLSVVVSLLDRPSGFAIDAKDIEATLIKIADEAKQARKSQPDRANALAERVLFAHRALCAEGGAALIELGPGSGLPCGASLAAGRALTIHIAGLARRGRLLEAVRRYGEVLDASKYTLTANDRERADYALRERTSAVSWRGGPSAIGVSALKVRRSAIELMDETRLIVRDAQGVNAYDMASGALEPAPTAGADIALRDPSGKLAVTSVFASCLGVQANIVNASQLVAGVASGDAVATPVLLPADPTYDGCSALGAQKDPRELSVLGWTSAGLVLARDAELLVIKLDGNHVAQPAQPLASFAGDKRALFAALGSSAISSSGRFQLVKTALGLLRVDHEQGGMLLMSWPAGVAPERVSDVAISPSGTRVALLADGRVFFTDATASASTAPAPAVPTAAPSTPAPATPAPAAPAPAPPTTAPRAAPPAPPEP